MVIFKERSRTSSKYIYYALQSYSSGLSLRKTSERLTVVPYQKKSCLLSGIGFNDTNQRGYFRLTSTISEFIIDETLIKVGSD